MPRVKKTFLFGFLMANIVASCSLLDAESIKPMLSSNATTLVRSQSQAL